MAEASSPAPTTAPPAYGEYRPANCTGSGWPFGHDSHHPYEQGIIAVGGSLRPLQPPPTGERHPLQVTSKRGYPTCGVVFTTQFAHRLPEQPN